MLTLPLALWSPHGRCGKASASELGALGRQRCVASTPCCEESRGTLPLHSPGSAALNHRAILARGCLCRVSGAAQLPAFSPHDEQSAPEAAPATQAGLGLGAHSLGSVFLLRICTVGAW